MLFLGDNTRCYGEDLSLTLGKMAPELWMFDSTFAFEMSSSNCSKADTNPSDSEQTSHVGALYLNRLLSVFSVAQRAGIDWEFQHLKKQ